MKKDFTYGFLLVIMATILMLASSCSSTTDIEDLTTQTNDFCQTLSYEVVENANNTTSYTLFISNCTGEPIDLQTVITLLNGEEKISYRTLHPQAGCPQYKTTFTTGTGILSDFRWVVNDVCVVQI